MTTDPELYNFEKFLQVASIIGVYLGIIFEQKYVGTHVYPLWNQVSLGKQLSILLITIAPIGITGLPNFLINSKVHSYAFIMVFKRILPPVIGNFYLFAFTKWGAKKTGLINKNGKEITEQAPANLSDRSTDQWKK